MANDNKRGNSSSSNTVFPKMASNTDVVSFFFPSSQAFLSRSSVAQDGPDVNDRQKMKRKLSLRE